MCPLWKKEERRDMTISIRTLLAAGLLALALGACGDAAAKKASEMTGGDPEKGRTAIRRYGCQVCHSIPGVEGARGQVGPALDGIGGRSYLAGQLPNTPENLIRWIREPQNVAPGTAMPDMGVTPDDSKDIAAYLYTLR
jgi:cytochrome c